MAENLGRSPRTIVPETDSADYMAAENNKQREWLSWQRPMTQVVNYDDESATG